MHIFNTISFFLLALAVPLWLYRSYAYFSVDARTRQALKRISRRGEGAWKFGSRIFGYLLILSALVFLLIYSMSFFKHGDVRMKTFSEMMHSRIYSGVDAVDGHIDALIYDQVMPVMVVLTALVLAASFTLVMTAIRDIRLLRRWRAKVSGEQGTAP